MMFPRIEASDMPQQPRLPATGVKAGAPIEYGAVLNQRSSILGSEPCEAMATLGGQVSAPRGQAFDGLSEELSVEGG
jgi:hypothetical protein